eukprot:TRINITY_DN36625_c0_g1_i1.p1 TRINITY_DN36625_c0_g1~~TRINITY_DN36625_c0_g1_i1.p1  ORF type:complete len:113 (-),score=16.96 TRINITY_DN36625_c0_g1_i1:56-394(-)
MLMDKALDHRALIGEFSAPSLLNIFAIVIHPDRRSSGLGTQLVESAVQHAAKAGLATACSVCTSIYSQAICTKLGISRRLRLITRTSRLMERKRLKKTRSIIWRKVPSVTSS